ncbi:hypothetical protein [Comamonas koreensis]|uniref:XRE family transcriptional regulator n=2 Tax=Comamonas koreensis TaxID=160825 RepID=A0AAW4XUA8_9BURK|nr:hypothetical protein [Comamonas koreensis]MCD2164673.1 hypothetical protein [Comamonas koreensis]
MSKRNWKGYRATSFIESLRACKNYALDCHRFSVLTIAERFGQTEDSLYKWLSNGRMPGILIPAYEVACCCNFVSEFLAATSGRMVIAMPKGRKASEQDLLQVGSDCSHAMTQLAAFYANPGSSDTEALLESLRLHMEAVAYHHNNVARYSEPELEFES